MRHRRWGRKAFEFLVLLAFGKKNGLAPTYVLVVAIAVWPSQQLELGCMIELSPGLENPTATLGEYEIVYIRRFKNEFPIHDSDKVVNMCWFQIVSCYEHKDILAKEVVLCSDGKNGMICLDSNSAAFAHEYSKDGKFGSSFVVRTPLRFAYTAEAAMSVRTREIDCRLINRLRFGPNDALLMIDEFEKTRSRRSVAASTSTHRVKIVSPDTNDDESVISLSTCSPNDSVSQISNTRSKTLENASAVSKSSTSTYKWLDETPSPSTVVSTSTVRPKNERRHSGLPKSTVSNANTSLSKKSKTVNSSIRYVNEVGDPIPSEITRMYSTTIL